MFEALEKAKLRNSSRLTSDDMKPPEVRNVGDIKRILAEYDPDVAKDGASVVVSTTMQGEDEQGVKHTYTVSANTKSKSRRTMLLDGFAVLQRQSEARTTINDNATPVLVNGHAMLPPRLSDDDGAVFIDPLIKQWMGAVRRGLFICWDLSDGYTYKYSIFEHKFTRVKRDSEHGPAAAGQL